jgi:hypothetical protein
LCGEVTGFACGSRLNGSKFKVQNDGSETSINLELLNHRTLNENPAGLSGGIVTDDLDVVAVGVQNERSVIIRMILRSRARRAVIFAAGGDGRVMKSVYQ